MSIPQMINNMKFNQTNMEISTAIYKLPISDDFLPLYFEILSKTDSPLIWGGMADLLQDICKDNLEFRKIILNLLEDPKTKGARGYLLNAVECFNTYDKRTIDIIISEIVDGNYECRHKASYILSGFYELSNDEYKAYIKEKITKENEVLLERLALLE